MAFMPKHDDPIQARIERPQQGAYQLEALYRLVDRLHRAESLCDVYDAALDAILRALRCDRASILLCDEEGVMRFVGARGLSDAYRAAVEGHSPWSSGDLDPQPICIDDVEAAPFEESLKTVIRREGLGALCFVPLIVGRRLIGKFMAYYDAPHRFEDREVDLALSIGRQLAFGVARRRAEDALRKNEERLRQDVNERQRLEDELRRRLGELAAADRHKNEFLAMLAHELRNPLAPMRNALHLMRMPGVSEEMTARARDMMDRQLRHLIRLVDDLLDVSGIIRGRIELRREPLEIATAAAHAVEIAQPAIDAGGHTLSVSLPDHPLRIDGDLVRLAQVIANLLTNAAKYMGGTGRIELGVAREDDEAVIRVRDTGVGIPPELQPQIFDLFVQGDHSLARPQGGLGIGLTLVRRLVEMHGGTVSVASAGAGQGSEFTIRLPALDGPAVVVKEMPAGPARERIADRRRVLVVDDNVDAADSMATILRAAGCEVRCVHDGPSAMPAAQDYRPDVILLDIGLPGVDGFEVARQLRGSAELGATALVALTGYGQDEDRQRSREAGFDLHLTKPVDPAMLEALVTRRS